jgi:hypothetical protein
MMKYILVIFLFLPLLSIAQKKPINVHDSVMKYYNLKEKYKALSGYARDTAVQHKCIHLFNTATVQWQRWFDMEDDSVMRKKLKN